MYKQLDEYIAHLARNKSTNTLKNYELHIVKFINWIADNNYVADPFELDQEVYLDYIGLLKKEYAPKTVHTHMTAVYGWLTFMHHKGYISKLPFVDSRELTDYLPVIPRSKVKALTKKQLQDMLAVTEGNMIYEAIIRLFYDTGMRVSELVNIKWSDITENKGKFLVHTVGKGKGGMTKERTVLITQKTYDILTKILNERKFESEYVLASTLTKKPFTTRRIDQIIKEIAEKADIDYITTHMFRKSIATHLLEDGMSLEYVGRYLGHANIATTQLYTDLDAKLHDQFNAHHQSL